MAKARVGGKSLSVQLTPMVKFYMGVAVAMAVMAAIFILAVLPMFKKEQTLERTYKSKVSEYEDILGLFEGRTPEETISSKNEAITQFSQEMERLGSVFPKAPELPGEDPGIFVVEQYFKNQDLFRKILGDAGIAADDRDFLPDPSSSSAAAAGPEGGGIDVPLEVHKMDAVLRICELGIAAGAQDIGAFELGKLPDEAMAQDPSVAVVPLTFTMAGRCRSLANMLYELDHERQFFFAVSSINIQAPEESVNAPDGPVLQVDFSVLAPYLKPQTTAAEQKTESVGETKPTEPKKEFSVFD